MFSALVHFRLLKDKVCNSYQEQFPQLLQLLSYHIVNIDNIVNIVNTITILSLWLLLIKARQRLTKLIPLLHENMISG